MMTEGQLKNYCGQSDERLIKGLSEIFEEIKRDFVKEKI